ncbi:hypothetical protein HDF18_14555 [Mucilaginibacter sp. X5P1]|uniref:hypothetical protein n=1 Tax=Mucilaginibacter sp. X5P1 TaxID=2723088 RepID=UPI00161BB6F7|nr:hypothetical protein [Mucilaginibacter sp. X5P1]MBB6138827.1 hypothetical protein [Mucilaginibacter sp. X5P1]
MKRLFLGFLVIAAITSCRKHGDPVINPGPIAVKASTDTLTSIYQIIYNESAQKVITSVSGDTLKMLYNEDVSVMLPVRGLDQSYAIHLFQDFTKSSLDGVSYITYDQYNDTNLNWVDDNLNNVKLKTISDTTVNKQLLAKIHVQRPFYFSKLYTSSAAATAAQKVLLAKTAETIGFSAYVYFVDVNYPTYTSSAKVVYVKAASN